jgi:hypothetical protein
MSANKFRELDRADLMEYLCDILSYTQIQSIKGQPTMRKVLPYAINIGIYNALIRNYLSENEFFPKEGDSNRDTGIFLSESIILTLGLQVTNQLFGGQSKRLMQDWLEVSAAMGLSNMYVKIKRELLPEFAFKAPSN